MRSEKLFYRPEIDGLRAIAVVGVILYHAQMVFFGRDWFEGGFIGVDIFFVVSGYLITRIILFELLTTGSFSFLDFYERRARRILPMLFVVIIVSIPFAWQKLLPSEIVEYAESILSSLFFGSNFFFYFSTTKYGANSALLIPFLHTWSLGVEEQFYLIFPIITLIIIKFFSKHFLTIVVGLSLLSLQFAELMEVKNSDLNFYLPFSRFWELAIGSVLAYRELNFKFSNDSFGMRTLPMLGLYLIVYSILFFDSKTPHPSFYTLMPVLGVALIITFSSNNELVGKILGSKPLVWMGLISYSAYLWHYPIFAFSRMGKEPNNFDKVEWIFLTLVLSALSFFLIERPFRQQHLKRKFFFTIVAIFTTALSIFSIYLISTFKVSYENIEESARYNPKSILDRGAFLEFWRAQRLFEKSSEDFEDNPKKKVLIVGNSHGIDFFRAISSATIYKEIDFGFVRSEVHCLYLHIVEEKNNCGEKSVGLIEVKEKLEQANSVILKTRWKQEDIGILEKLITSLIKADKNVLIVGNAFEQKNEILLREFVASEGKYPIATELDDLKHNMFETAQHTKVNSIDLELKKISQKKHVQFISSKNLFCDYEVKNCELFTPEGYVILWDYGHLTVEGSKYVGRVISKRKWGQDFLN